MSPERDDDRPSADDVEAWEEEASRPLLSRVWVRVALVVVVVGAIAAVATPYVLTSLNTPPAPVVAPPEPSSTPRPNAPAVATSQPASAPAPVEEKSGETTTAKPRATGAAPGSAPALTTAPSKQEPPARARAADATAPKQEAKAIPAPSAESKREASVALAKKTAAHERGVASAKTTGGETGEWWVQVGAFRDPATAEQVAARLELQRYRVVQSTTTGGHAAPAARSADASRDGSDRYDVFVAATTPADAVSKLAAKGLSAEARGDGAIVKPSLSLRDAVALSKDLASEGFKVQVKRVRRTGDATRVASTPTAETLHRVRVGAFADRATAVAALKRLEALGYTPFVAREARHGAGGR